MFGLAPPTWFELVRDEIASRLCESEAWREPAWGMSGTAAQRGAARDRLERLLAELPGTLGHLTAAKVLARGRRRRG